MPLIWELCDDPTKINLCNFQWSHYQTKLDLFNQSQHPIIDHLPEEQNLGKFMAERPHSPAKVN